MPTKSSSKASSRRVTLALRPSLGMGQARNTYSAASSRAIHPRVRTGASTLVPGWCSVSTSKDTPCEYTSRSKTPSNTGRLPAARACTVTPGSSTPMLFFPEASCAWTNSPEPTSTHNANNPLVNKEYSIGNRFKEGVGEGTKGFGVRNLGVQRCAIRSVPSSLWDIR